MKRLNLIILGLLALLGIGTASAQERSAKYSHVLLPEEIKFMARNNHKIFVASMSGIWTIDPETLEVEEVLKQGVSLDSYIQGIAAKGDEAYAYIGGKGVYSLGSTGKTIQIVYERDNKICRNFSEDYRGMNIDPTGEYLVLYGFNENAVVFQIHPLMTPVIRYDNNVSDAHVADRALWASCPNMVVYNTRLGKSMDNRDFIFTGDNDQTGMTKFRVSMTNDPLPNMGENEKQVGGAGEIQRLILNKQTGDILMCTSTFGGKAQSQVYKMTPTEALLVTEFPGSYGDFAAYGTRIIAKDGGGFFEAKYGDRLLEAKTTPIVTDIRKKPLWKGDKPDFYRISGSHLMDFDEAGNLMTAQGRDFWIIRK